ncbi:MAG: 50S ribosomal protein L19 [Microgenomates group bacterium ADurb.Bin219]|nr:MAG: 50S ribosomal protein L19 [Microgenomates group bacterium ADurb.Bin219]HNP89360.1 50S ribosomal protein L19 [Candidatus Woesebacteria bacterium]
MTIQLKINEVDFAVGDYIKIIQSIREGDKERTAPFEGTVIAIKGRGDNKMFTVRKIAIDGIGVEKIFPVKSPTIAKITVKKKGHPRRAKLYYLRKKNAR